MLAPVRAVVLEHRAPGGVALVRFELIDDRAAAAERHLGPVLRRPLEQLEQERAKLAAVLDGMIEGVIAVDGRDIVLIMNGQARSIFGVPRPRDRRPFLEVIRNTDLHEIFRELRGSGPGAVAARGLRLTRPVERILYTSYDGTPIVLMHSTDLAVLANLAPESLGNTERDQAPPAPAASGAGRPRSLIVVSP